MDADAILIPVYLMLCHVVFKVSDYCSVEWFTLTVSVEIRAVVVKFLIQTGSYGCNITSREVPVHSWSVCTSIHPTK